MDYIKDTTKTRAPRLEDPVMQKVVNTIYDEFAKMKDSVNRPITDDNKEEIAGNVGDIRFVKDDDQYRVNFKTEEGWVESVDGTFKLKG